MELDEEQRIIFTKMIALTWFVALMLLFIIVVRLTS